MGSESRRDVLEINEEELMEILKKMKIWSVAGLNGTAGDFFLFKTDHGKLHKKKE